MSGSRSRLLLVLVVVCSAINVHAQPRQPRIALVLTGGGARGLAQIGVLKELYARHLRPDIIVGSSFGAIVGGLYAAGYDPVEIEQLFLSVDLNAVTALSKDKNRQSLFYAQKQEDDRSLLTLRFRDFAFLPPQAISGSARFAGALQNMLWQSPLNSVTDFDDLRCRFRAVATDLVSGTSVSIRKGNLATALQASASFPLRYAPVRIGDSVLVDGGLINNIPTRFARELRPDLIIVVNTVGDLMPTNELDDALDVADQALSIAMKQLDSANLAIADIVIRPDLTGYTTFDFTPIENLVALGEAAARKAFPTINDSLRSIRDSINRASTHFTQDQRDSIMYVTFIDTVDVRASFPVEGNEMVDSLILDIDSRGWSDAFVRHYTLRLHQAFRRHGFDFAYVRAMAHDASIWQLKIHIDQGRLSSVEIDPRRPVKLADVEREIAIDKGDVITVRGLQRTAENLRASDLFDNVDLTIEPARDSGLAMIIGNQVVTLGARVDNERYGQFGVDLIQQNLFTTGLRLGLRGYLSPRIGEASARFEIPRIANTLLTTSLKGYASFRNVWIYRSIPGQERTDDERARVGEYSEDRIGARLSAGRQLERNGVILGELRYEQQRYRDLSAATIPTYQPLSTARIVARWDDRDDLYFPSEGRVIDIAFETSIVNFSNGLSFTKASANVSTIVPIGDFAVTPSFMIGAADKTLPGAELFSLGGQEMFFGMRQDEERGRQIVVGNLEGRWRSPLDILFPTYFSVRYDIGAVWAVPEQIRIANLQHGIGATVAFDTPVGPAAFSLGRRFKFLAEPDQVAWGALLGYFDIGVRL
jgi:NTE family protein